MEKGQENNANTIAGTPGYVDPEYFTHFRVNLKSDVYRYVGKKNLMVSSPLSPLAPPALELYFLSLSRDVVHFSMRNLQAETWRGIT